MEFLLLLNLVLLNLVYDESANEAETHLVDNNVADFMELGVFSVPLSLNNIVCLVRKVGRRNKRARLHKHLYLISKRKRHAEAEGTIIYYFLLELKIDIELVI